MSIGTYISTINLHVTGFNDPTKRCRLVEWKQKQDYCICCLHFRSRDTFDMKMQGLIKVFCANRNQTWSSTTHIATIHIHTISDIIDIKIRLLQDTKKDTTQ